MKTFTNDEAFAEMAVPGGIVAGSAAVCALIGAGVVAGLGALAGGAGAVPGAGFGAVTGSHFGATSAKFALGQLKAGQVSDKAFDALVQEDEPSQQPKEVD